MSALSVQPTRRKNERCCPTVQSNYLQKPQLTSCRKPRVGNWLGRSSCISWVIAKQQRPPKTWPLGEESLVTPLRHQCYSGRLDVDLSYLFSTKQLESLGNQSFSQPSCAKHHTPYRKSFTRKTPTPSRVIYSTSSLWALLSVGFATELRTIQLPSHNNSTVNFIEPTPARQRIHDELSVPRNSRQPEIPEQLLHHCFCCHCYRKRASSRRESRLVP